MMKKDTLKHIIATSMAALMVSFGMGSAVAALETAKQAARPLMVLELFTSQGCSSCPPADAVLRGLSDKSDILALSWAVDYWDRLGWKDTFAMPLNTVRQMAYNKRFGKSGIYTPQIIVDGLAEGVGSRKSDVTRAMQDAAQTAMPMQITPQISVSAGQVMVDFASDQRPDQPLSVRLVFYTGEASVEVGNGENKGRALHYANIVRQTDIMGEWSGGVGHYEAALEGAYAAGADHAAVLLHYGYGHGPIIGAAHLSLPGLSKGR